MHTAATALDLNSLTTYVVDCFTESFYALRNHTICYHKDDSNFPRHVAFAHVHLHHAIGLPSGRIYSVSTEDVLKYPTNHKVAIPIQ